MTAVSLPLESLILPVTGICVLIPLFIGVLFEPKKAYSRKIYFFMLVSCFCILITEFLQWCYDGKVAGSGIIIYTIFEFMFFMSLISMCLFWTLYSYYWFNGHRPSKKTVALFAISFECESLMLLFNIFTGFIYSINSNGVYERQNGFTYFIVFCYSCLIIAISITAVYAVKRNGRMHVRDFLRFVLFFLFPIIGPILQYFLPALSVMGISESIALLTLYVLVQQRTNAEYEVEKARYQEEYLQYENTLEGLLSVSADALCVVYLDLTKNIRREERGTSEFVRTLLKEKTVDDLFSTISFIITEEEDRAHFNEMFSREGLLHLFSSDKTQVSLSFHRKTDSGESHLVKAFLSMLKNPSNGDIEAIAYSIDMDKQEKEEKVISAITKREYDYIALIDANSKKLHYQYFSHKLKDTPRLPM